MEDLKKRVLSVATPVDVERLEEKKLMEEKAAEYIQNLVLQRSMPLNILDTELQFDNAKLTVYFEASSYVQFHQLVRDIYKVYKTRIWLEQVGGTSPIAFNSGGTALYRQMGEYGSPYRGSPNTSVNSIKSEGPRGNREVYSPTTSFYSSLFSGHAFPTPVREIFRQEHLATGQGLQEAVSPSNQRAFSQEAEYPSMPRHVPILGPSLPLQPPVSPNFSDLICPISQELMTDPVVCSDGFSYDRRAIVAWFSRSNISPITREPFSNKGLRPNHNMRLAIHRFREQKLLSQLDRLSISS